MNTQLASFVSNNHIPHALLFTGNDTAGKKEAAYQFTKALLKSSKEHHPDAHLLFPEGKTGMHPIASIRQLIQEASLVPYEAPWKIFILHEAEKMLPASSNVLLKILEEPPPQTILLLLSDYEEKLLPTLVSRCQVFPFTRKALNMDQKILTLLQEGVTHEKLAGFESENTEAVFETLLLWFRDRLILEIGGCDSYLHFPQYKTQLHKTPLVSLDIVEKAARQARLAAERSTKLSTSLELFFLSL